jgi:hypothetical protein
MPPHRTHAYARYSDAFRIRNRKFPQAGTALNMWRQCQHNEK